MHERGRRRRDCDLAWDARVKANSFDSTEMRRVLGHYPTGVVVVTAVEPSGSPVGLAIGSFTSVSLDPPLVAFLPAKTSTTWPRLSSADDFCVNVLSQAQVELGQRFAFSQGDKFAGLAWTSAPSGSPILPSVAAWIECQRHSIVDAGDHWIVLGQVTSLWADPNVDGPPLVFYRGGYGYVSLPTAMPAADSGRAV